MLMRFLYAAKNSGVRIILDMPRSGRNSFPFEVITEIMIEEEL